MLPVATALAQPFDYVDEGIQVCISSDWTTCPLEVLHEPCYGLR